MRTYVIRFLLRFRLRRWLRIEIDITTSGEQNSESADYRLD